MKIPCRRRRTSSTGIIKFWIGIAWQADIFSQNELNNLVRDLGLSEDGLLGSRLKENNLLSVGVTYSGYRHREGDFAAYYIE